MTKGAEMIPSHRTLGLTQLARPLIRAPASVLCPKQLEKRPLFRTEPAPTGGHLGSDGFAFRETQAICS